MPQLVYIHGSGHTRASFAAQMAAFPDSDALSLPGHPEGRTLDSIADCADWLARYLRWKGGGRAIVAGNSLGGAVALEWALRYPADAAGLILLGTGARLRVSPDIFRMIDEEWPACIQTIVDWELSPGAPAALRASLASWHDEVGQANTRKDFEICDGFDVMERVSSIAATTLVVVGSADAMTPVKYSEFLHARIAGSRLAVLESAGHLAHAERPDEVNALIRETFPNAVPTA